MVPQEWFLRGGSSGITIHSLESEACRLLKASLATYNTTNAYRVGLERFRAFRLELALSTDWPPHVSHIVLFIAYLSLKGLAYATARSYLNAVSFQCKTLSKTDNTKHFLINKVMECYRRSGHAHADTFL